MLSILKSIANIIISLVQFVINTITSIINLLLHLPSYISFITSSLDLLPSVIIPFCVASIAIYVVYLVIGRDRA